MVIAIAATSSYFKLVDFRFVSKPSSACGQRRTASDLVRNLSSETNIAAIQVGKASGPGVNESPRVSWRPVGLSQTDMTA